MGRRRRGVAWQTLGATQCHPLGASGGSPFFSRHPKRSFEGEGGGDALSALTKTSNKML
jgi:hypothetical protein